MVHFDQAAIALALVGILAVASAAPGHAYGAGYGFIAAGPHGHAYGGHGHYSQPGVASVQANQNNHAYQYGVSLLLDSLRQRFRLCVLTVLPFLTSYS